MKLIHWAGVVAAMLLAVAPILVPELPHTLAAAAPAALAIFAIVKHAADTEEKPPTAGAS